MRSATRWTVRLANLDDAPALEELVPCSARTLQAGDYTAAQIEAALGPVFGVDRQLITDGTYFVAEAGAEGTSGGRRMGTGLCLSAAPTAPEPDRELAVRASGDGRGCIVGCGGWSRRKAAFGGDQSRSEPDELIDPAVDPARIRAFFVHPAWARRGIGRALIVACESAIARAGIRRIELVATLTGEALYAALGYGVAERYSLPLAGGLELPVIRMTKSLGDPRSQA